MNNIYIYWIGRENSLIKILRGLIYLHSKVDVHLINHENITNYITKIPECFYKLCPAHQADYVRVNVICEKGGIWLDSDTLVMDSLESLVDLVNEKNGFFIKENPNVIINGVFGSKPQTTLMIEWKNRIDFVLSEKRENIEWDDIGNSILQDIYKTHPHYYGDYILFNGPDNMYPVTGDDCVKNFIENKYDNYKQIIRDYQPLIILVHQVYQKISCLTIREILDSKFPLNYFINKSLQNTKYFKN